MKLISVKELENRNSQKLEDLSSEALTELSAVKIRDNPYCFLYKDVPVKITFSENAPQLAQLLINYFMQLKQD